MWCVPTYFGTEMHYLANHVIGSNSDQFVICQKTKRGADFSSAAPSALNVSGFIKATTSLQDQYHWSTSDKAAMMLAILQGAVANTVPTAYWYCMHILSSPSLVTKLRNEVEPLAVPGAVLPNGKREMLLDIRGLEEKAPLLVATFRENQRNINVGTINRWVISDTVLTSPTNPTKTYLLKKDTPVLISSMLNHFTEMHWGPDVSEFNPDRFLRIDTRTGKERKFNGDVPVQRGVFTPFGGGKHLCPGRNFASTENWGTMIAILLGFDITTPEGGQLELPPRTIPFPTHAIGRPVAGSDLRSSIRRRKGWENVVWKAADVSAPNEA
jgi:cytochrome P450